MEGLELLILLLPPPKGWENRCAPPHQMYLGFVMLGEYSPHRTTSLALSAMNLSLLSKYQASKARVLAGTWSYALLVCIGSMRERSSEFLGSLQKTTL